MHANLVTVGNLILDYCHSRVYLHIRMFHVKTCLGVENVIGKYPRFVGMCIHKAPKVTLSARYKYKGVSVRVWWRKNKLEHVLQGLTLFHIFKSTRNTEKMSCSCGPIKYFYTGVIIWVNH